MPQQSAIVVKDVDGTTDVTFATITPAAGNGGVAEWALKEGGSPAGYVKLTLVSDRTGVPGRRNRMKMQVPVSWVDADTGLRIRGKFVEFDGTFTVPDEVPDAVRARAQALIGNVVKSAHMVACNTDAEPST